MSIPGAGNPLLLGGAAGGYKIERSTRLNASDSAFFSRTPASASNQRTWTWSGWVKRSGLGNATGGFQNLFSSASAFSGIRFTTSDTLEVFEFVLPSGYIWTATTAAVFRDPSAWYHVVFAYDTTQATNTNRIKLYINNVLQTFASASYPAQNRDGSVNSTNAHSIGCSINAGTPNEYFSGYITEVHFIDGQALTPSSFGEFDDNGIWQPKAFSGGSYGTNGFKLTFADNSAATATTLGKDTSGNGNNWTPNNLSVTAGAGNDSLVDSPTNYGTDTGAGGEVRGNYCTLNPLIPKGASTVFSNGNLKYKNTSASSDQVAIPGWSGVALQYWEATATFIASSSQYHYVGDNSCLYSSDGKISGYSGVVTTIATYTTGDILGFAVTVNGTVKVYKNGSLLYTSNSGTHGGTATGLPTINGFSGTEWDLNFGQRPWAYPANASGFKALCTTNLPAPTITKPSTVMDVKLYTGNGSTQTISGLGFSPDLVWIKTRSIGYYNVLYDTVRGTGTGKALYSNTTDAEGADATLQNLTAFNSDGFSLGTTSGTNILNDSNQTRVAWAWDAGSSTVTNTSGTISSQVRANASAGFSVVTYTGNGVTGATVGHGLGVAPGMIILKRRDTGSTNWYVYHSSIGNTGGLSLNSTSGTITSSTLWNNTSPSSTVVTLSAAGGVEINGASGLYVLYCFAPVAGYSAFGSYTGNGNADGPFVYTGFRPALVIIKNSSGVNNWLIFDNKRDGSNVNNDQLYPNTSAVEDDGQTNNFIDLLSNGFKFRNAATDKNANAGTYIYAAFAEAPFALARAR